MGCIPVVLNTSINSVFDGLPVLIVTSWEDVNEDLLNRTLEEFSKKEFDMSRIRFGYWASQIAQATNRPNLLTEQLPQDRCPDRLSSECTPVQEAALIRTAQSNSKSLTSLQWSYVVLYLLLMVAVYFGGRYFGKRKGRSDGAEEELEPLVGGIPDDRIVGKRRDEDELVWWKKGKRKWYIRLV